MGVEVGGSPMRDTGRSLASRFEPNGDLHN